MGRTATWLLIGAVAALGVAAAVDALRGEAEPDGAAAEPQPPPTTTVDPGERTLVEGRAQLRAAGVPRGVLFYVDERCRLHAVTLPDLGEQPESGLGCDLARMPGGGLAPGSEAESPDGLRRSCRGDTVEFRLPGDVLYGRTPGTCPVAWRGDRTPTFLRDGEVVELAECPQDEPGIRPFRCGLVLLSRRDLDRELRRVGWTGFRFRVEEFAWLDQDRLAAILGMSSQGAPGDELLVVFDGRRLVEPPTFAYEDLAGIRPSPTGRLVSARILTPGGLVVLDRDGRRVDLAMRHGDAITWSPTEHWIAEATADGVYVFRAGERSPAFIHLPIVARDLVWR